MDLKDNTEPKETKPSFHTLSVRCPWRVELKCSILHSAGYYAQDGCSEKNCGFMYWQVNKELLGG